MAIARAAGAIETGEIVLVEKGSPGLVPSMHFNDVDVYGRDLHYRNTLLTYPLLEVTPTAAITAGDALIVAEGRAEANRTMTSIVRHAADGTSSTLGPRMEPVVAMAFGAGGDLFVALSDGFVQLNPATGRVISQLSLPQGVDGPIRDFDFDVNGCDAIIATPRELMTANLCVAEVRVSPLFVAGSVDSFGGVRFAPNGDILLGSNARVYRLANDGALRSVLPINPGFDTGSCKMAIEPEAIAVVAVCGLHLSRLALATGEITAQARVQYGMWVYTVAIRDEWRAAGPRPRRRAAPH